MGSSIDKVIKDINKTDVALHGSDAEKKEQVYKMLDCHASIRSIRKPIITFCLIECHKNINQDQRPGQSICMHNIVSEYRDCIMYQDE